MIYNLVVLSSICLLVLRHLSRKSMHHFLSETQCFQHHFTLGLALKINHQKIGVYLGRTKNTKYRSWHILHFSQ